MKTKIAFFSILIFAYVAAFGQTAREQAKELDRPKDSGISDYDAFKNSSFKLLGELQKTDGNYETIKKDVAGYESGDRAVNIDNVKGDINRLKALKKNVESMDDRVKKLSAESEDLMANVSKVKPVTKVKAATSNTKKAVKAVDVSKAYMKEITTQVNSDLENLSGKLAELGGE